MADNLARSFEQLALEMEQRIHAYGWDQPALIWPIQPIDILQEDSSADIAVGFALLAPTQLEGHPADALVGCQLNDDAVGAVLSIEGYDYSESSKRRIRQGEKLPYSPSQDPGRVEVRIVSVLLKDDTIAVVIRRRGEPPQAHEVSAGMDGRVVQRLRVVVGLPSTRDVPPTPKAVVGHVASALVLTVAAGVLRDLDATPSDLVAEFMGKTLEAMALAPLDQVLGTLGPFCSLTGWRYSGLAVADLAAAAELSWAEVRGSIDSWAAAQELEPDAAARMAWFDPGLLAEEALEEAPGGLAATLHALTQAGVPEEVLAPYRSLLLEH